MLRRQKEYRIAVREAIDRDSPCFFGGCASNSSLLRVTSVQSSFNRNGTTAWSISNVSLVASVGPSRKSASWRSGNVITRVTGFSASFEMLVALTGGSDWQNARPLQRAATA